MTAGTHPHRMHTTACERNAGKVPVALTVCLHACTQHMGKGMSKGMMGLKRHLSGKFGKGGKGGAGQDHAQDRLLIVPDGDNAAVVSDANLAALPRSLARLAGLQTLRMRGCAALTALPEGVGLLTALHTLDLCECSRLASLPESLSRLGALRTLDPSKCASLAALPASVGTLSALQALHAHVRTCGATPL